MKKINLITTVGFVSLFVLFSCNDILDESPDNRTEIDALDKIKELLVAAYPEALYAPFLEPMSDNADDKGPSARDVRVNEEMYFWRDLNDDGSDTPTNYWNEAYEAIAQANQALVSLDELGFTDVEERGEALLCRAYGHFMLVSIFSKAYNPATAASDLGVTYVKVPETTLLPDYKRNTVQEVYDNIESDLVEGLKYIGNDYDEPGFHFTVAAANAFASRFYLHKGDWEKVVTYSNLALGTGDGANVLRDWEFGYRPLTYSQQTLKFSSATLEPANLLVVVGGSIYNRNHFSARYQLSGTLADELFSMGNPVGRAWSYSVFGSGDLSNNIPKYYEYFRITNQATGIGFAFVQISLLTTDEVILNRAEAYAMLGQLQSSADDINASLSVKSRSYTSGDALSASDIATNFAVTDPTLYTPFYSISADALPFIDLILKIKKTVFYNEGLRWFDIKRHNIAITHRTALGNSEELPKDDNRRALQIPAAAQALGIEANPR